MRKYFLIAIAVSILFEVAGCGSAKPLVADKWSSARIERAPAWVMSMLESAGDRSDYPNAHTISVFEFDSVYYYPDGNQELHTYSLSKLLTMKSTKDYGTIPIGYDTQQMTIDILYIRVVYPDSSVVTVGDSSITDGTMEEYAGMDIYWSNLRQKTIHMPELEVGCGIEIAVRIKTVQPMLEGLMDFTVGFQGTEPTLDKTSILVVPASVKMKWKVFNDPEKRVKFSEKVVGDSLRVYRWWGKDFPMAITEDGMPPISEFVTKVLASNSTWEEYSRKVFELSAPNMIPDEAIKQTVAELTKDAKSDLDTIRAIAYYTSQKVRYIGLSMSGKEGITPHDVRETFKAQCGVCKDKSALLAVMLETAGFEAYVALSNPLNHVHYEISANQFNHMIVVVYDRAGNEIWIDPTDALCMDMLPAYHMEKAVLICDEKGDDLRYLPVKPPQTQAGNIIAQSEITKDGTYKSKVTISGKGIYDQILRIIFQQMEPTQQRRFWTEMLKNRVHPSAKITKFSVSPTPVDNLWEPVLVSIDYEIPDYAIVAGDYLLVKSPVSTGAFDIMGLVIGQTTSLAEREFPLNIQFTLGSEMTETIKLPGGYKSKSLPGAISLENKSSSFETSYEMLGDKVVYNFSFMVKKPRIPAEEYADYRNTVKKAGSAGQGMIILEKGGAK